MHFFMFCLFFLNHHFQTCFKWSSQILGCCHFLCITYFLFRRRVLSIYYNCICSTISHYFHFTFKFKTLTLLYLLLSLDLLCHICNLIGRDSWIKNMLVNIYFLIKIFKMMVKSWMLSFCFTSSPYCSSYSFRQIIPCFRTCTPKTRLSLIISHTWVFRLILFDVDIFFLSIYYCKLFFTCSFRSHSPQIVFKRILFTFFLFLYFCLPHKGILLHFNRLCPTNSNNRTSNMRVICLCLHPFDTWIRINRFRRWYTTKVFRFLFKRWST